MLVRRTQWLRNGADIGYTRGKVGVGTIDPTYELDIVGNMGLAQYLYHNADVDTHLNFEDDKLTIQIGGEDLITLTEAAQDVVKLGDGGDVDINLNDDVFIQGSDGNVGIGTTSPSTLLHIQDDTADVAVRIQTSNVSYDANLILDRKHWSRESSIEFLDAGGLQWELGMLGGDGYDFSIKRNAATGNFLIENGNVGIGITGPLAKLHIDQAISDAAIPALSLDQADVSDGFINFLGATAASAVGPISSWTTGNSIQGFVRVEINNSQYWMPYYDAPTS